MPGQVTMTAQRLGWTMAAMAPVVVMAAAVLIPPVTAPLWEPALVAVCAGLAVSAVLAGMRHRGWALGRRWGWALVGVALAVPVAFEWAVPARMALTSGAPSASAAHLLATTPDPGVCSTERAYLHPFLGLIAAQQVCVSPHVDLVTVHGPRVPATGVPGDFADRGLIYAPHGAGPGNTADVCLRHIYGPWWLYQRLVLECPVGMQPIGSG